MLLPAEITIRENRLAVSCHGAFLEMKLPVEFSEWIWEDHIGGGDRRKSRVILGATAVLTDKGIKIQIGTAPLFRTLDGRARGILVDRLAEVAAGVDPKIFQVVQL